jgi:hypothetical protein
VIDLRPKKLHTKPLKNHCDSPALDIAHRIVEAHKPHTHTNPCTNMKKGSGSWHPNTLEASDASGTYEFQAALPRLPVPPVPQSIKQYLHSVSHLMSPHEMESPATSTPRQVPSATSNMKHPGCCRSCQPVL